jgi:hypothetical protein
MPYLIIARDAEIRDFKGWSESVVKNAQSVEEPGTCVNDSGAVNCGS